MEIWKDNENIWIEDNQGNRIWFNSSNYADWLAGVIPDIKNGNTASEEFLVPEDDDK